MLQKNPNEHFGQANINRLVLMNPKANSSPLKRAKRSYPMLKVRRAAVRRYPSSKVRSNGCALLEQP